MLALFAAVPAANATLPRPISGTVFETSAFLTSIRFVDGNIIGTNNFTGVNTGDFNGTFVGTQMFIVHLNGSVEQQGSGTFTGTLFGSAVGTSHFSFRNKFSTLDGIDHGRAEDNQGTGGLAGVHAEFTYTTPFIGATYDVYSGQAHFESS